MTAEPTQEMINAQIEAASEEVPFVQTEELSLITAQVDKEPLENDKSCPGGETACNGAGICQNKVCFCDKYHAGENCEKDLAHPGVKAPLTFIFYGVALLLGLCTGAFVAYIYN